MKTNSIQKVKTKHYLIAATTIAITLSQWIFIRSYYSSVNSKKSTKGKGMSFLKAKGKKNKQQQPKEKKQTTSNKKKKT